MTSIILANILRSGQRQSSSVLKNTLLVRTRVQNGVASSVKRLIRIFSVLLVALVVFGGVLFGYPRPTDTTEARVFASNGAAVNYCDLPELDGSGPSASDIPKAFTPDCGWTQWPMPILANCREPLAEGVVDLRGLWRSTAPPGFDHVERIEQCGNRTVVTAGGIIHDFFTDGTLANGSRDIEPPSCINTWVAIDWEDEVMEFHPFGLPYTIVTRQLHNDQLVWNYPRIGEVRMDRICQVPPAHATRSAG